MAIRKWLNITLLRKKLLSGPILNVSKMKKAIDSSSSFFLGIQRMRLLATQSYSKIYFLICPFLYQAFFLLVLKFYIKKI